MLEDWPLIHRFKEGPSILPETVFPAVVQQDNMGVAGSTREPQRMGNNDKELAQNWGVEQNTLQLLVSCKRKRD